MKAKLNHTLANTPYCFSDCESIVPLSLAKMKANVSCSQNKNDETYQLIQPDSGSDFTEPEEDPDLEELMSPSDMPKESTIYEAETIMPNEGNNIDFQVVKREFINGLHADIFHKAD